MYVYSFEENLISASWNLIRKDPYLGLEVRKNVGNIRNIFLHGRQELFRLENRLLLV